ncbi:MAG: DUF2179 domain-containing protein [Deltaproteobacteria bacterium]|nr:DUF2179 domain-containing protein [Deltaproteobacteria bacterium]
MIGGATDPWLWELVILPVLIFVARLGDVTLATVRIIYLSKGIKRVASLLGFFEMLIWLLAIGQVMQHLTSGIHYVAYAAGFACGNYLGMMIEDRLAVGRVIFRIITRHCADELLTHLRREGYGVTVVDAMGAAGPVKILFTVLDRQHVDNVILMIEQYNPRAFYSIEDVRTASEGTFRVPLSIRSRFPRRLRRRMAK